MNMNIRKIALACTASAAIVGLGLGLGDEAAFASPAHTATAGGSVISNHPAGAPDWGIHASAGVSATAGRTAQLSAKTTSASTPPWRAEGSTTAHPATCSNDFVVDANAVRIHKWPLLSAPTVAFAWYGQHEDVLAFYNDGWAEIRYHGTEEWMRSQFLINEGLCY